LQKKYLSKKVMPLSGNSSFVTYRCYYKDFPKRTNVRNHTTPICRGLEKIKLAIIGSRTLINFDKKVIISHIPPETTAIISGGAQGIDNLAKSIAEELGLPFLEVLPNYKKHGKTAPLTRNAAIVSMADRVLAVWDFTSRGTAHVIAQCIEQKVPVQVIGPDGIPSLLNNQNPSNHTPT
jgi:hypothetical protein